MTRASELRDTFDRGFAAPPSPAEPALVDVLCVRIGDEPCALRLGDIASLHADLRIVALPTRAPELLGVAAIRAAMVPIYDLAVALGLAGTAQPRWVVVHRGGLAGFAFADYDGHARIAAGAVPAAVQRGHLLGHIAIGEQPRSVVDLGSVLTAIETR